MVSFKIFTNMGLPNKSSRGPIAYTMWKFHDFSITQILREINFGEVQKLPFLTHLVALNFYFYEFFHFLKAEIYKMNRIHSH